MKDTEFEVHDMHKLDLVWVHCFYFSILHDLCSFHSIAVFWKAARGLTDVSEMDLFFERPEVGSGYAFQWGHAQKRRSLHSCCVLRYKESVELNRKSEYREVAFYLLHVVTAKGFLICLCKVFLVIVKLN